MSAWMDKIKRAGKGVVDAGAKTMLKTDIAFLDREIKQRKQEFGIEIYDLMAELETDDTLTVQEKEAKIRTSFDAARKDIAVIAAKKECKQEEMSVLDVEGEAAAADTSSDIPPASGAVLNNTHPSETAAPAADATADAGASS